MSGGRDSGQLDLIPGREPVPVSEIVTPPWYGRPPQPDVDPVGIPDTMTCGIPDDDAARADLVTRFGMEISPCLKCQLGETRTNFVYGTGNRNAAVMFVGEAPGKEEDLQGEPFVGRAGGLLNQIIEAIGFTREEVYIGNILKHRLHPGGGLHREHPEVPASRESRSAAG